MIRQVFNFSFCFLAILALVGNPSMGALTQYWTFDSDATNSVAGGIDGTFVGAATIGTAAGEYNVGSGALKLSHDTASGDFVDIAGKVIPSYHPTAFTVSTWFKEDPLMGSQAEDSRQFLWENTPSAIYPSGAGIYSDTDQVSWYMQSASSGTIAETGRGSSVDDGKWHHIAVVYDYPGGTADLYLDGALDQSLPAPPLMQPTDGLHIGNHRAGDGSRNWRGYIDDFAIYNGTLDAAGVAGLYDKTYSPQTVPVTPGPASPDPIPTSLLQAYWTFDSDYSSKVNNEFYQGTPKGGEFTSISDENVVRGSGALKLDHGSESGSVNYVDIVREVADPERDKQITVSAWYNLTDISGDGMDDRNFVWESSPTYSLSYSVGSANDGEWWYLYDVGSNSDTSGPTVTEGEWNHVVMVLDMDAETIQYYHNGELIDDVATAPDPQIRLMNGFHIGDYREGTGGRNFDGYIDDVAVFHGLLDADGVAALYNGTATPETVNVIVPEPGSLAIILSAAFAGMLLLRRRV